MKLKQLEMIKGNNMAVMKIEVSRQDIYRPTG